METGNGMGINKALKSNSPFLTKKLFKTVLVEKALP